MRRGLVEKYKLNLAVALVILLITIWLIWARRIWDFIGYLLLIGVFALILWTLLRREKEPAKLLEFFVKSLVVFYVAVSIIWFVYLGIASPLFYVYFDLESLMDTLVLVVLPLSLLPVAMSVIIYGIFRIKLRFWEFFLSGWYVSTFVVFTIYQLSSEPASPYSSIAGAIAVVLGLLSLSFLIAGIISMVYVILKKQKITEPK